MSSSLLISPPFSQNTQCNGIAIAEDREEEKPSEDHGLFPRSHFIRLFKCLCSIPTSQCKNGGDFIPFAPLCSTPPLDSKTPAIIKLLKRRCMHIKWIYYRHPIRDVEECVVCVAVQTRQLRDWKNNSRVPAKERWFLAVGGGRRWGAALDGFIGQLSN